MKLPPTFLDRQMLLVAIIALAQRVARTLEVRVDEKIGVLADHVRGNRAYVYQLVDQILEALLPLAAAKPGRPPKAPDDSSDPYTPYLLLQNQALRFRLDHPGAYVTGPWGRHEYSPSFRRFVLEGLDGWPEDRSLSDFASAVEVPLDTLRDWIDADRKALTPPAHQSRLAIEVPRDASNLVHQIASLFAEWEGDTRSFLREAAQRFALAPAQVARVLRILGCIRPYRPSDHRVRYRGSTEALPPGSVLVSDGTNVTVCMLGPNKPFLVNWQGTVDQTTGCHTAFVVSEEESGDSLLHAYWDSCEFLGRPPLTLLHDNKPCYNTLHIEASPDSMYFAPTELVSTTLGRAENKAVVEGAFGLFAQQVGFVLINTHSLQDLAQSVASEVVRAWAAGRDHSPHPDFGGKSRHQVLRESCPSPEELERASAFLRRLKSSHEGQRRPRVFEESRRLLDHAFHKWDLEAKDPRGSLRRFLSRFTPDAVRRALALFAAKMRHAALDRDFAHRYLAKLVQNMQEVIDLEVAQEELLELCRLQQQNWNHDAQLDLALLQEQAPSLLELARGIAERAALGAIPVDTLFWTRALLDLLRAHLELAPPIRRFLVRLYEAPFDSRLALIDKLAALEVGLL